MPRRSGSSREFWDADDLYEGHAAARERNREVYDFEDGDDDRSRHKGRRAGRQQKAQAAQASAALKRDYVLENYQKHYSFIRSTAACPWPSLLSGSLAQASSACIAAPVLM